MVDTFRVGLLITERCNIECDHCWFCSSPVRGATMNLKEIISFVDQAGKIPTIRWISLTGGEPFLYPGLLESSVKYASERKMQTECVTNCFWAKTEHKTEKVLEKIVEAGLDVINISADDFHQQHIPFERVRNCFNASKNLGLKVIIMCAAAKSSTLRAKDIKRLLDDEDIQILGAHIPKPTSQTVIVETGFTPVGRGAEISKNEWLVGESPITSPCNLVLRDIGVTPSGRVLSCCSAASLLEVATLGNLKEKTLFEILAQASQQSLFNILSSEGPSALGERLHMKEDAFVSQCHLCYEVLKSPDLAEALSKYSSA